LKFSHRGGSAPRATTNSDLNERKNVSGSEPKVEPDSLTKSKSLPPKNESEIKREEEERQKEKEKEEQKRLEFEERLRRLPTPGQS